MEEAENAVEAPEINTATTEEPQNQEKEKSFAMPDLDQVFNGEAIDVRKKGITNGALQITQEIYRKWIEQFKKTELLQRKIEFENNNLLRLNERYDRTLQERARIESELVGFRVQVASQSKQAANIREQLTHLRKTLEEKKDLFSKYKKPYLSGMVWVYGIAAVAFMVADMLVLLNLFDTTMEIPIEKAIPITTAFIASIVALKPAVDFVIEKNSFHEPDYDHNDGKLGRFYFYAFIAILILVLITFFSYFRATTEDNDNLKQILENSSAGVISLTLMGPTFALAGALLISIAHRNYKIGLKAKSLNNEIHAIEEDQIKPQNSELIRFESDVVKAESKIQILNEEQKRLPSLEELEIQMLKIREILLELFSQKSKDATLMHQFAYDDCYEIGQKHEMDGTLSIQTDELVIPRNEAEKAGAENSRAERAKSSVTSGNYINRRRPYIFVRKQIARKAATGVNKDEVEVI
jgi:hypothetical protein